MPRIVHFELLADDLNRATEFYRKVFGWKIDSWGGPVDYRLVTTGLDDEYGINGAIAPRGDMITGGTIITVEVQSVETIIQRIIDGGGKVIQPRQAIPGIGYHAYCQDPEGTIFGIMERDESAR